VNLKMEVRYEKILKKMELKEKGIFWGGCTKKVLVPGVYILVRKRYLFPPLMKMIFFPPLATHSFSTPIVAFLP
jgi:hypothetical protein